MKTLRAFGALLTLATAAFSTQAETQAVASRSGYAKANGLKYYYEISGKGEPLLLLHGGLGSTDMFKPIMPAFTEHRQIIAIDLQGHGRTELGSRKLTLPDLGDDMATVLTQLGFKNVDVMGYSFGGGVSVPARVQHPEMVRRLALVSAGFARRVSIPKCASSKNRSMRASRSR
jgi:pimeloyl-ACP methyl ester carboxylesterase